MGLCDVHRPVLFTRNHKGPGRVGTGSGSERIKKAPKKSKTASTFEADESLDPVANASGSDTRAGEFRKKTIHHVVTYSTNSWPTTLGLSGFAPNFRRTLYGKFPFTHFH
jgi:hypothetical protein